MARVKFGKLEIDPARNPAVLDTTTWDTKEAWQAVQSETASFWKQAETPANDLRGEACTLFAGSHGSSRGDTVLLASLRDGQDVFVEIGERVGSSALGKPINVKRLDGKKQLAAFPCDMQTLDRYLRLVNPEKAPRPMGSVPRLGIGNRHTVAMWPAIYRAMDKGNFAANAVQNSLRELNMLPDLKNGTPAHKNYLFSFGTISEGHTGSTFEGLLHAGVVAALKQRTFPRYGADADHIQVKRGPDGLERAKRVIESARYFTFFTLDVSDILDYAAVASATDSQATSYLDSLLEGAGERKDVLAYHRRERKVGGVPYAFNEAQIGRFVGKYWKALAAVGALCEHIRTLKGDVPFDVELSIDENPPEVTTCSCITSPEELIFLTEEIIRRHLPVTHLAPNLGVEKGTDYRCPDGRAGLDARLRTFDRVASEFNLMLDCHSGDDLSKETRQTIGRATRGRINFKISPQQQIMFAETLYDMQPDLFRYWWDDVYRFVEGEARSGSEFAARCIADTKSDSSPHPSKDLFHYYCYVSVGRRDERGQFVNREQLYGLSEEFLAEFTNRFETWMLEIAADVYGET